MTGAAVTGLLLERSGASSRGSRSALSEARAGSGTFVVIEGPPEGSEDVVARRD